MSRSTVLARSQADREELHCVGAQNITVSGTAQALTLPDDAMQAKCQVQGETVRYRLDGVAPTATVGELVDDVDKIIIDGRSDMANFEVILASGSTTSKLFCQYFG